MKSTYSISQAQSQLPRLLREMVGHPPIRITRHAETVAYLMATDYFEALIETLEMMSNASFLKTLQKDRKGQLKYQGLSSLDED